MCKKYLGSAESFLIYTYDFAHHHNYDWSNSMPMWLSSNYVTPSVHKEITL